MTSIGVVMADGSILLHDENIKYREEMTAHYQRIAQSPDQKDQLDKWGYQAVNSSFISGVGVFGDNLRIRFHNASVYEYYGFADRFDKMLMANSKGQFFNYYIRPTKRYKYIGKLEFPSGVPNVPQAKLSDEQMFQVLEFKYLNDLVKQLNGQEIKYEEVQINGIPYHKYVIDKIQILRPISQ